MPNSIEQFDLHDLWLAEAESLAVPQLYLDNMETFLGDMQIHHVGTYEHSMRVGMLAPKIGKFVEELEVFSPRGLFYAGTMHDIGKLKTPSALLSKTSGWTEEDAKILRPHPFDSYEALLQQGMVVTAGAVILHHTFQPNGYPSEIPAPDAQLPERIIELIPVLGRVLALSDFYDASHRKNSAGSLSDEEIRSKVSEANPDLNDLIDTLYVKGVFK